MAILVEMRGLPTFSDLLFRLERVVWNFAKIQGDLHHLLIKYAWAFYKNGPFSEFLVQNFINRWADLKIGKKKFSLTPLILSKFKKCVDFLSEFRYALLKIDTFVICRDSYGFGLPSVFFQFAKVSDFQLENACSAVGWGRVGWGRVGSGRVECGRVGSDRAGWGLIFRPFFGPFFGPFRTIFS